MLNSSCPLSRSFGRIFSAGTVGEKRYKLNEKTSITNLQELMIPGIIQYMTTVMIGFLGIHAAFLVVFVLQEIPVMIIAEVLSLISYMVLLWKLHYKITKYDTKVLSGFVSFVLAEVNLYMIIAALSMGEGCNFDNYVYGLLVITFFQFYISHDLKKDIALKIMIMVSYLGVKLCETHLPPLYRDYSPWVETFFTFVNPTIVTVAIILFVIMVPLLIINYEDKLTQKASVDELTGLLNRAFLDKIRFEEKVYNLAMLDIDNFKKINDKFGHDCGDLVLKDLGRLLKKIENECSDTYVIRWGGEEFMVVYRVKDQNKYAFLDIMEQLRKSAMDSAVRIGDGRTIHYQVTVGVAFSDEASSYEALLKIADSRLYWGKQNGRNMVVFHEK